MFRTLTIFLNHHKDVKRSTGISELSLVFKLILHLSSSWIQILSPAILWRLHVSCKSPFDCLVDGWWGMKGPGEREINWISIYQHTCIHYTHREWNHRPSHFPLRRLEFSDKTIFTHHRLVQWKRRTQISFYLHKLLIGEEKKIGTWAPRGFTAHCYAVARVLWMVARSLLCGWWCVLCGFWVESVEPQSNRMGFVEMQNI